MSSEEWGDEPLVTLLNETKKLLANDGLDATRIGGSNGLTTYSTFDILKLLHTYTVFIRKGKWVKLLKRGQSRTAIIY